MWEVKCTLCELVDMTCFASLKAQTIAQRSNVMFFFRDTLQMTRDLCIFCFFTLQMTWEFAFFCVCPTTPMSSAATLYIYIFYDYYYFYIKNYMYYYIFIYLIVFIYRKTFVCIYIYGSRWSCAPVSTFSSGGFQCYKLHIGWAGCLGKGLPRTLQTATLLEWCAIPDTPPEWLPTTTTNSDRDVFFLDCAWRSGKQIWRIMG